MAASTELAFIALSLALGLGICTANRAVLNVAREGIAAKPPPIPVFNEANRPNPMEAITTRTTVERGVGTAGLTEVAGNNGPSELKDLGGDGNSPDYNSVPLSKWTGQALYCSPLECQGGDRNEYAGDCGGFSVSFDFDGPRAYKKSVPPPATGIDQPPAPILGGPDCGRIDGLGYPVPPKSEQEDSTGILTDGNNENDLGSTAPNPGVAEPDPGK